MERRTFLKHGVFGTVGSALGTPVLSAAARAAGTRAVPAVQDPGAVALIKGDTRYGNMMEALGLIKDEIRQGIGNRQVVIKPNMISFTQELASTNPEHIKAIMDFIKPFYSKKVIVAESSPRGPSIDGFRQLGYLDLQKDYPLEFVDLNLAEPVPFFILDKTGHPLKITIPKLLVDPNTYLISAARMKVHNSVVVTLSNKNITMGAPQIIGQVHCKQLMHQGIKEHNFNLYLMTQRVPIHLATIDGFQGMHVKGPRDGEPVDSRVAIASTDSLAADRVGIECMNANFEDIGHLTYCANAGIGQGDLKKINIKGEQIANCRKTYQLNENIKTQLEWKA